MQTSLRSNYQYYDYGTLDCTTRHIQHLPDHDHHTSSNHIEQRQAAQHLQQSDQQQTATHHHELIQHQTLIGDPSFEQQESAVNQESSSCFTVNETTQNNTETAHQTNNDSIEGQIIVYDHQQQQQQQYHHLLSSTNNLHQQQHLHHHLDNGLNQNPSQNEEVDNIYNQHQNQLIHHHHHHHSHHHHHQEQSVLADPVNEGATAIANQVDQIETPTTYPTIYYEPINFTESCAIEQQHHQALNEQPQTFTSHLIDVSQFVSLQQQQHQQAGGSAEEGCTYFQTYQSEVVNEQHRRVTPLLDNQENQNYNGHQQLEVAPCEQQQVYQTLEISGNHSTFAANQQGQVLDHSFSIESVVEPSSVGELQQSRQDYHQHQELDSKKLIGYNHLGNCYMNSESTSASTIRSQDSPACSTSSSASSSSEVSSNSTLTRDEKRAREANIPLTYHQIVNLSIDQFNEHLAKHNLTESQLTLIKDIRRRGKNKVAAQSCRKRKMEQIYELQHEVDHLAIKKRSLNSECNQLMREHNNLVQKYNEIYPIIHCFNKDTWNS